MCQCSVRNLSTSGHGEKNPCLRIVGLPCLISLQITVLNSLLVPCNPFDSNFTSALIENCAVGGILSRDTSVVISMNVLAAPKIRNPYLLNSG